MAMVLSPSRLRVTQAKFFGNPQLAGSVTQLTEGYGITLTPNPINAIGTVAATNPIEWINVKAPPYNAVGNGIVDDSVAIQNAFTAGAGKTIYFPPGIYLIDSIVTAAVASYVVFFDGCTLKNGTAGPTAVLGFGNTGATVSTTILGQVTLDGNSKNAHMVEFSVAQNIDWQAETYVKGIDTQTGVNVRFGVYITNSSNIRVRNLSGDSSYLVWCDRCGQVEISSCNFTATKDMPGALIDCNGLTGQKQIRVHDVHVNGAGFGMVNPITISVAEKVQVSDYNYRNTGLTLTGTDALDIIRCDDVTLSDILIDGATVTGISAIGSRISIDNVVAQNCGAGGISIGDPTPAAMPASITDIVISNSYVQDCGLLQTGGQSGGIVVQGNGVNTVTRTKIVGCVSRNTDPAMLYGLSVFPTALEVTAVGCDFSGNTYQVYDPANNFLRPEVEGIYTQFTNFTTTGGGLSTLFGIGNGRGSLTIPAGRLMVGSTIEIELGGYVSTATTAGTHTMRVILGGMFIFTQASTVTITSVLNMGWTARARITCQTTGGTGTVIGSGMFQTITSTGTTGSVIGGNTVTSTVATDTALTLDVQINNGQAVGTYTTTSATIRIVDG